MTMLFLWIFMWLPAPADLPLIYEQDFEKGLDEGWQFSDTNAWKLSDSLGNRYLELYQPSSYEPPVRSPLNIALLPVSSSDFVLELDLRQTGREYGHRDMCLFFGVEDAQQFYYVHLASKADPNAHNVFLVNNTPRTAIASKTTSGIRWDNNWHHVKIERLVNTGTIRVFFDDMDTPIMEASDRHFLSGAIGVGSFDDTGQIDNIRVYGRKASHHATVFR